jgi:hypothetical protein
MTFHPEVERFRDWLAGEYRADGKYEAIEVLEDLPEPGISFRLRVPNRSFYEVRSDAAGTRIEAGFATESRIINESIEQMVLDNGGDLSDLLGDELCDLGEDPLPMEHFFERPAFRFVVRLALGRPEELEDTEVRRRVKSVLKASEILFQACVDEA